MRGVAVLLTLACSHFELALLLAAYALVALFVPVEFLSDEQVAGYGRFAGVLSRTDIERFSYLTEVDLDLIAQRRSDVHRIGFGVQLARCVRWAVYLRIRWRCRGRCSSS